MGFADDIRRFKAKVAVVSNAVFVNTASHAHQSIVDGSPVTGAPGQPVADGTLKNSWQLTFPSPTMASITTNVPWAPANEDGVTADGRPYVQRSPVGGRHSVKLTIAGLDRIVAVETQRANGGAS